MNEVVVTIRRDGTFAPAEIAKPSGSFQLDDESLRPFRELKGRLLPLPQKYEGDTLRIRFRFEYKR